MYIYIYIHYLSIIYIYIYTVYTIYLDSPRVVCRCPMGPMAQKLLQLALHVAQASIAQASAQTPRTALLWAFDQELHDLPGFGTRHDCLAQGISWG